MRICEHCGTILSVNQTKFCSKRCSNVRSIDKAVKAQVIARHLRSFTKVSKVVRDYDGTLLTPFVEYSARNKVLVKCNKCHKEVEVAPAYLYRKKWYCQCSIENKKLLWNRKFDDVKGLVKRLNGTLLTDYEHFNGNHNQIRIKCDICSDVIDTLPYTIAKGHRWNCSCSKQHPNTMQDVAVFGQKQGLTLLDTEYVNMHYKYQWQCSDGHKFCRPATEIQQNRGCPKCHLYLQEERCRFVLEQLTGSKFPKTRNVFGTRLELDGFSEDLRIAFEYHGIQHYQYHPPFHRRKEQFESQQKRDQEKEELCSKNVVKLIVVPYSIAKAGDDGLVSFLSAEIGIKTTVDWSQFRKFKSNIDNLKSKLDDNHVLMSTSWAGNDVALKFHCYISDKGYERQPMNVYAGKTNCPFCGGEWKNNNTKRLNRAIVFYQRGNSIEQAAKLAGCGSNRLSEELKRIGIPFHNLVPSDPHGCNFGACSQRKLNYDLVVQMYESGSSQVEISKSLKCSVSAINRIIRRKRGIPIDPKRKGQAISKTKLSKKR